MYNSPDQFMFNLFDMCSCIYLSEKRQDYLMLSTGSNDFPMSNMWKSLIGLEINYDFLYQWYIASGGFACVRYFIQYYHRYLASGGKFSIAPEQVACITIGASQAINIANRYLHDELAVEDVFLLGFNYSAFDRVAKNYGMRCTELRGENNIFPSSDEVKEHPACKNTENAVYILEIPNNPSGEMWETEKNFAEFFEFVKSQNSWVIVDLVGFMPITEKEYVIVEQIIEQSGAFGNVILVNSFSKTDSVPGFRLGYIYANKTICKYAERYLFYDMMNVPAVPIFPIIFTLIFRIIFISKKKKWNLDVERIKRFSKQIIDSSCAIPNPAFIAEIYKLFENSNFDVMYKNYIEESLHKEKIIQMNYHAALSIFQDIMIQHSRLDNGFNFIMLVRTSYEEEFELCKDILEQTGISILTESCFTIVKNSTNSVWIRFSLAKPSEIYINGLEKLKIYLEGKSDNG